MDRYRGGFLSNDGATGETVKQVHWRSLCGGGRHDNQQGCHGVTDAS